MYSEMNKIPTSRQTRTLKFFHDWNLSRNSPSICECGFTEYSLHLVTCPLIPQIRESFLKKLNNKMTPKNPQTIPRSHLNHPPKLKNPSLQDLGNISSTTRTRKIRTTWVRKKFDVERHNHANMGWYSITVLPRQQRTENNYRVPMDKDFDERDILLFWN